MHSRLCLVPLADVERMRSLLEGKGLHPLIRIASTRTPKTGDDSCYYIELPEDEVEKGRHVLAGRKRVGGLARQ